MPQRTLLNPPGKLKPGAPRLPENLVLGKETGKDRYAADRQPTSEHRRKCDRHVFLQAAHSTHVLLVVHSVNDRAGTEEEQCLEKRVRHDVEDRRDKGADATREKHVAELRDRRIGENLLDVVLCEADRRGKHRSCTADDRNDEHRGRSMHKDRRATNDHVDAGRDHRRCVDQCRNWRRAGHRIRQPDVQRNLCALTRGANEKKYRD